MGKTYYHRPCDIAAKVIAALYDGPKAMIDIVRFVYADSSLISHSGALAKYVKAFHDAGIVYIMSYNTVISPVWAIQPVEDKQSDAPVPAKKMPVPTKSRSMVMFHGRMMLHREIAEIIGCSQSVVSMTLKQGEESLEELETRYKHKHAASMGAPIAPALNWSSPFRLGSADSRESTDSTDSSN